MALPFTFDDPLPDNTRIAPARIVASDGGESSAWLYEPAGPPRDTVVYLSHPRAEFGRHYLVPALVRAGHAVCGHNARYLNNDIEVDPAKLVLDVAGAVAWLRERFARVVAVGNSGGATLVACAIVADVAIDALVVLAAHGGEGRFLLGAIDPSVTDENDPLSCDPALDMFCPDNGYDARTRTARYAPEFLARYRAAQRARVERLDERARTQIAFERAARADLAAGRDVMVAARRAIPHRLMVIYRTVANPAYLDLSIDPNDRDVGSIFGLVDNRPELGNYFELNVARVLSPRAWLSTWSGVSARPDFLDLAPRLTLPTLFVYAAGDSDILPADAAAMWNALGAADRTRHDLAGADHYLRPTSRRASSVTPRAELVERLDAWLRRA